MPALGAHGALDPQFMSALPDDHIHDVGDADSRHDQRQGADRAEKDIETEPDLLSELLELDKVVYPDCVFVVGIETVFPPEQMTYIPD